MGNGIILIQPPLDLSYDFVDYPYHCDLSVVQGAAVLRAAGLPVAVVDAFALPASGLHRVGAGGPSAAQARDARILLGAPVPPVLEAVCAADSDPGLLVVGYTAFHRPPARDAVLGELLAGLRARFPSVPILLADLYQSGQHYVAAAGETILEAYPEVDALLQHEAEGVLVDVCRTLLSEGRPDSRGSRSGGEHDDVAGLPVPAWDLVDLDARDAFLARVVEGLGRGAWAFPVDGRTLPAISSRGCPYRCAHCSSNPGRAGEIKRQRRHTPETAAALIDALVTEHGATRIALLDEMVNVDPGHFDALLEALSRHAARYDFPNGMRADWVRPEQLDAMAGRIATLSVSAESGDQRVVDEVVGKALDLAAIEATVAGARERGIPTLVHFIIGMPGETREEINRTLEWALHLHEAYGAWPGVQFATPLPGTRLAETAGAAADLPVIDDYNPVFQHRPVTATEAFTAEDLYWFKWTFDQRLSAGNGPTKVIMNVTYRCNNRCTFCAVGTRTQLDGSFERQKEILERYRAKGIDQADFDGGEPTLYEELVPLVRHARRIGYRRINVTTNGRMCVYEDYARKLVRSGLTTLLFSVHGHDAKTHAQNVGVPEAFEQTLDGIRHCVKHRPAGVELGMNVTITKSNHAQLPDMTKLAHDLGLRWMNLQFLTPFGRATIHVNPDTAAAAKIATDVIDAWKDRMRFQVINLPFCFMPGYEAYMTGDLQKLQRHMVFVNNEDVNLHEYLKERRSYHDECHGCRHKVFCGGFYDLENAPEPEWLVTEDDIQAPLPPVESGLPVVG